MTMISFRLILSLMLTLPYFGQFSYLNCTPDLTLIGFLKSEDGLGKVPINIINTVGQDISINIISTAPCVVDETTSPDVVRVLNNPDQTAGRVALLTNGIWYKGSKPAALISPDSIVKMAYSMHESNRIPSMWIDIINKELDAVVVPDPYLVKVYQDCGITKPIFILPIPMALSPYYKHSCHPLTKSKPFVFGDASANKNPAVLLKAFAQVFKDKPNVKLVMRAGVLSQETKEIMDHTIQELSLTNVIIEDGFLSIEDYINRLLSFDCFVNLSKGEGFSFIPREALALGLPVIITDNTASKTICKSGYVYGVKSKNLTASSSTYQKVYGEECGNQFDCSIEDAAAALQEVYTNYKVYAKKARKGRKWVKQYDCKNPELQALYRTLIKPEAVVLGDENTISNGVITTNCLGLYEKYQKIIKCNRAKKN